jgi:hypothetical protein
LPPFAEVLAGERVGDVIAAGVQTRVKPGLRVYRRHVRGGRDVVVPGPVAGRPERRQLLGVPLLHHAEAAELAIFAVEVSVVVRVAGDEAVAADVVIRVNPRHDVHWKRQARDPWPAGVSVFEVEAGGRGIVDCVSAPRLLAVLISRWGLRSPIRLT